MIKRIIVPILVITFFLNSYCCHADGFGWRLIEVDYKAIETFPNKVSNKRKKEIVKELNDYYLNEMVTEDERDLHKRMIDVVFTDGIHYDRLSFVEAMAVDRIFGFLFTAESPIQEILVEDFGFYVPVYCMKDIIEAAESDAEIIPLLERGRRFRSRRPVECEEVSFDLGKELISLNGKDLTENQEKRMAEIKEVLHSNENKDPCYYSYLLLSPKEVADLASELEHIKSKIDFSYDDECFFKDFINSIIMASKKKSGLYLYTTD